MKYSDEQGLQEIRIRHDKSSEHCIAVSHCMRVDTYTHSHADSITMIIYNSSCYDLVIMGSSIFSFSGCIATLALFSLFAIPAMASSASQVWLDSIVEAQMAEEETAELKQVVKAAEAARKRKAEEEADARGAEEAEPMAVDAGAQAVDAGAQAETGSEVDWEPEAAEESEAEPMAERVSFLDVPHPKSPPAAPSSSSQQASAARLDPGSEGLPRIVRFPMPQLAPESPPTWTHLHRHEKSAEHAYEYELTLDFDEPMAENHSHVEGEPFGCSCW